MRLPPGKARVETSAALYLWCPDRPGGWVNENVLIGASWVFSYVLCGLTSESRTI
jgi:hypothetical protein